MKRINVWTETLSLKIFLNLLPALELLSFRVVVESLVLVEVGMHMIHIEGFD